MEQDKRDKLLKVLRSHCETDLSAGIVMDEVIEVLGTSAQDSTQWICNKGSGHPCPLLTNMHYCKAYSCEHRVHARG